MTEPIRISPQVMRDVANQHDDVAEQIATARMAGPDIGAAVESFGPIMHQVKAAVSDVLTQREAALLEHDETHRNAATGLRREAMNFVNTDEYEAERLRLEHG